MHKKIIELAEDYSSQGKAFIHSEWTLGSGVETLLAGDLLGQLYIVSCVVDRICQITGEPFKNALESVALLHNKDGCTEVVAGKTVEYDSNGIQEQIEKRIEAEIEKKYSREIQKLKRENNRLNIEVASHMSTIKRLQEKVEVIRKISSDEISELQKTIIEKEKEVERLLNDLQDDRR